MQSACRQDHPNGDRERQQGGVAARVQDEQSAPNGADDQPQEDFDQARHLCFRPGAPKGSCECDQGESLIGIPGRNPCTEKGPRSEQGQRCDDRLNAEKIFPRPKWLTASTAPYAIVKATSSTSRNRLSLVGISDAHWTSGLVRIGVVAVCITPEWLCPNRFSCGAISAQCPIGLRVSSPLASIRT
jgi:hypothetical protein